MSAPGWRKDRRTSPTSGMTAASSGGGEAMAMVNVNDVGQWRAVFDQFDTDGDGWVRLGEFKRMLATTNLGRELPPNVQRHLIARADQDHDGIISFNEFLDVIYSSEITPGQRKRFMAGMLRAYTRRLVVPRVATYADVADGKLRRDLIDGVYDDQYTCTPPPLFVVTASIVEVGVFIYYAMTLGNLSASTPVPFQSPLIYNPYRRYEAWRYLSYMLIHAGYIHILFNMIIQLMLGVPLEMVHKWWRVGLIYFAGVVAGSLGTSISDPVVFLAGASGGVYALITAHLATIILNFKEMEFAVLQLIVFFIITGSDVGVAVYTRYAAGDEPGRVKVGYAAHVAGAVAGLLVGIGVLRNLEQLPWERKLWWACMSLYVALMLIAIIWNVAYPDYFPPSKWGE